MKKLIRVIGVVLVVSMTIVSVVSANGVPGSGWWSGEMVQNVGDETAHVVVTAYGDGEEHATVSTDIEPDGANNFTPNDFSGMGEGFQGAAVVQSDMPIKAVVNVTNREAGDFGVVGGEAAAQYQGIDGSAVADTLYFPMAKNDRFDKTTAFYIQNAGSSADTAVCVFKMDDGGVYTYTTPSISSREMVLVTPSDAEVPSANTNRGNIGSLTVSSAQPLAGVVMEYKTNESPATLLQATRGFTSQDFDTKRYAPTIKQDRYGRFTGIQVQNVEVASSINVTITLVGSRGACDGQEYVRTYTDLGPGESHTFNQIAGQDGEMVDNCAASATIESTGNIVAVVSESFTSDRVNSGTKQASTTYSTFSDAAATQNVSVPMYKENRYSKYTGLMVQNVGSEEATNVVITFVGSAGGAAGNTYETSSQTIPPGGSIELSRVSEDTGLWSGTGAPSNSTFGVKIVADQNVVAIANEAVYPGATLSQDKNNYEGFNLE